MDSGATPDAGLGGPSTDDPRTPGVAKTPYNALDRLQEMRRKVRSPRDPLRLEIPGYNGTLVAAYRVLDWEEMKALREKGNEMAAANDPEAELKVTCDTIAEACVGIYLRENGKDTPLNETVDEFGDEPVRYEWRLAEALGVDTKKVRVLIREMFPTDISLISHLTEISRWMESERADDDADFQKP